MTGYSGTERPDKLSVVVETLNSLVIMEQGD